MTADGRLADRGSGLTIELPLDGGGHEVPFCRTEITAEAQQAAQRVLASGWVTMGAESLAFETELASWVGVPHAVAVSSCTAAIQMAPPC